MIILLDTSTPTCKITIINDKKNYDYEWLAERMLAKDLLAHLNKILDGLGKTWTDISAIGVFEGPGSFTGLRIGMTVMNTIADSQDIPINGGRGDDWQEVVLDKLKNGKNEKIVLPFYEHEAHITSPRK